MRRLMSPTEGARPEAPFKVQGVAKGVLSRSNLWDHWSSNPAGASNSTMERAASCGLFVATDQFSGRRPHV